MVTELWLPSIYDDAEKLRFIGILAYPKIGIIYRYSYSTYEIPYLLGCSFETLKICENVFWFVWFKLQTIECIEMIDLEYKYDLVHLNSAVNFYTSNCNSNSCRS